MYWERTKDIPNPTWTITLREVGPDGRLGAARPILSREFHKQYDAWLTGPIRWSPDGQWVIWSLRGEDSWFWGQSPFYQLFRMRVHGDELQEIPLERFWWTKFWREYLVPSDKNGFLFDFQWFPDCLGEESLRH